MHLTRLSFASLLVACALAMPSAGRAQDVDPGYDFFTSSPSGTLHDFSGIPVPPSFFDPGSDPFQGIVFFAGAPTGAYPFCPLDDLFNVDTIIRRPDAASVIPIPSQDQIPIEIVQLSLVSVSPIVVTYGGVNPEPWTVRMDLSPSVAQFSGTEWIYRTSDDGGLFDTYLPIVPRFIFQRQSDNAIRVLDFGITGALLEVSQVGSTWAENTPPAGSCTSSFCAAPGGAVLLTSNFTRLALQSVCPQPPVQADTRSWGSVKAIYR